MRRFSNGEVCPPKLFGLYDQAVVKAGQTGMSQVLYRSYGADKVITSVYSLDDTCRIIREIGARVHGCIIVLKG